MGQKILLFVQSAFDKMPKRVEHPRNIDHIAFAQIFRVVSCGSKGVIIIVVVVAVVVSSSSSNSSTVVVALSEETRNKQLLFVCITVLTYSQV